LELLYCKPFDAVREEEKNDEVLAVLGKEMGVRKKCYGPLLISNEEMEAAKFYAAFCFRKV
jgi:mRNA (guanine-N7-)-methyltransferase